MRATTTHRPAPQDPPSQLHARAMDDLHFIRSTTERAAGVTAVSGWGIAATGAVGPAAGALAPRAPDAAAHLILGLVAARVALAAGMVGAVWKARRGGTRLRLRIAVDYSARDALAAAAALPPTGAAAPRTDLAARLGAAMHNNRTAPVVDLLVRTGGEQRLSDFLLRECACAELWFTPTMWPDFDADVLARALADFTARAPLRRTPHVRPRPRQPWVTACCSRRCRPARAPSPPSPLARPRPARSAPRSASACSATCCCSDSRWGSTSPRSSPRCSRRLPGWRGARAAR